ncbi:MAG TPA: YtxH domain-containing protein [Candidatus Saccharimonadales bacterium]|jgi:gas vesicle protein
MVRWQDIQDMLEWRTSGSGRNRPDTSAVTAVFLTGAMIGVATGLLLAPQSGEETRARIRQKARDKMDRAKRRAGRAQDAAGERFNQAAEVTGSTVTGGDNRSTRQGRRRSSTDNDDELLP